AYTAERPAMPVHFLLMNRPDPNHAARRVFVDGYAGSGLAATRDGAGNRGFGGGIFADLDNDGHLDLLACPGAFNDPKVVDECAAFLGDGAGRFAMAPMSELEGAGLL